jgi:hypothetical protein
MCSLYRQRRTDSWRVEPSLSNERWICALLPDPLRRADLRPLPEEARGRDGGTGVGDSPSTTSRSGGSTLLVSAEEPCEDAQWQERPDPAAGGRSGSCQCKGSWRLNATTNPDGARGMDSVSSHWTRWAFFNSQN